MNKRRAFHFLQCKILEDKKWEVLYFQLFFPQKSYLVWRLSERLRYRARHQNVISHWSCRQNNGQPWPQSFRLLAWFLQPLAPSSTPLVFTDLKAMDRSKQERWWLHLSHRLSGVPPPLSLTNQMLSDLWTSVSDWQLLLPCNYYSIQWIAYDHNR